MRENALTTMRTHTALFTLTAAAAVPFAGLAAAEQDARMFTWHDTGQDGLTNSLLLSAHRGPDAVVAEARAAWEGLAPEDRVIMIAPWEMYASVPFEAPLADLVQHGPDFSDMKSWWSETLAALDNADLAPAQVALDYEHGMSYWHLDVTGIDKSRTAHFEALWRDADARAQLPQELLDLGPAGINWRDRETVQAWNLFADEITEDAIEDAFTDPLKRAFPDASIGNYADANYSEDTFDANDWKLEDYMTGDTSHPVLYNTDADTNLDLLASVVGAFDDVTDVIPWIKAPRLMGWDAFEATVEGAYALGVRDFLLFNPGSNEAGTYAGDNAFAANVIEQLNRRHNRPEIRLAMLPEPATLAVLIPGVLLLRSRRGA